MTPKAVETLEALDRETTEALAAQAAGLLSYLDETLSGVLKATNVPPSDDPVPDVERYSRRRLRDAMSLVKDEVLEELQWTAIAAVLNVDNVEFLYNTLRDPLNVKGHLRRQVKQIVGSHVGIWGDVIDGAWESGLLRGYETGGGWAARELTGGKLSRFDLQDANILNAIGERSKFLSSRFGDRLGDDLSGWLADQMLVEGRSPLDARDYLRRRGWTDLTGWQIDRIARTEAAVSVGWGKYDTFLKNGVETVEWQTHVDRRTRDSHRFIDGQVIAIGSRFSNGLRFPGDPLGPTAEVINCRCNLAAVDADYVDPHHIWTGQGTPPLPVNPRPGWGGSSKRSIQHLYETTLQNDGATWNPRTGQYASSGYAVGVVDDTYRIVPKGDADAFERAVNDLKTAYPEAHVGTWVPEGSNEIHIDPSMVHYDRAQAVRDAVDRNQRAIFNLGDFSEVHLNVTPTSMTRAERSHGDVMTRHHIYAGGDPNLTLMDSDRRKAIKAKAVEEIAAATGLDADEYGVNVQGQWTTTAGDDSPNALLTQIAAKDEFGLTDSDWQVASRDPWRINPDTGMLSYNYQNTGWTDSHVSATGENLDNRKATLRAVYDRTQKRLTDSGVGESDYVTVYRGMNWDKDAPPILDNVNVGDSIDTQMQSAPLSSWSTDPSIAQRFADQQGGGGSTSIVMTASVHRSRILSTGADGLGALPESEIILLDTPGRVKVLVTGKGQNLMTASQTRLALSDHTEPSYSGHYAAEHAPIDEAYMPPSPIESARNRAVAEDEPIMWSPTRDEMVTVGFATPLAGTTSTSADDPNFDKIVNDIRAEHPNAVIRMSPYEFKGEKYVTVQPYAYHDVSVDQMADTALKSGQAEVLDIGKGEVIRLTRSPDKVPVSETQNAQARRLFAEPRGESIRASDAMMQSWDSIDWSDPNSIRAWQQTVLSDDTERKETKALIAEQVGNTIVQQDIESGKTHDWYEAYAESHREPTVGRYLTEARNMDPDTVPLKHPGETDWEYIDRVVRTQRAESLKTLEINGEKIEANVRAVYDDLMEPRLSRNMKVPTFEEWVKSEKGIVPAHGESMAEAMERNARAEWEATTEATIANVQREFHKFQFNNDTIDVKFNARNSWFYGSGIPHDNFTPEPNESIEEYVRRLADHDFELRKASIIQAHITTWSNAAQSSRYDAEGLTDSGNARIVRMLEDTRGITKPEGMSDAEFIEQRAYEERKDWIESPEHSADAKFDKVMDEYRKTITTLPYDKWLETHYRPQMIQHASDTVDQWSTSAGDDHPSSLLTQIAAQDEFGLDRANPTVASSEYAGREEWVIQEAGAMATQTQPGAALTGMEAGMAELELRRRELRAMYERTQAELKAAGVEYVTLYRGMALYPDQIDFMASVDPQSMFLSVPSWYQQSTVYHGAPLSSWALDPQAALPFARSGYTGEGGVGVLARQVVPRERIFSTARTGFGALPEMEVVTLDSLGGGDIQVVGVQRRPVMGLTERQMLPLLTHETQLPSADDWTAAGEELIAAFERESNLKPIEGQTSMELAEPERNVLFDRGGRFVSTRSEGEIASQLGIPADEWEEIAALPLQDYLVEIGRRDWLNDQPYGYADEFDEWVLKQYPDVPKRLPLALNYGFDMSAKAYAAYVAEWVAVRAAAEA